MGALSINGIPALRAPFEPLVPEVLHVRNTNRYHRPPEETEEQFTRFLLDDLEQTIEATGPETVAMVIMEPVQNAGGAFTPPEGYWQGVRELCDHYEILLCADEVITGFGRLGALVRLGALRHPSRPRHLREGALVGLRVDRRRDRDRPRDRAVPRGRAHVLARDHLRRPPRPGCDRAQEPRDHAREKIVEHVAEREGWVRDTLGQLLELPIVGDVRGTGFFYALELVKDKETRETFSDDECERLLRGFLSPRMFEAGLICRADDRGDPVIQISPPLVAGKAECDELVGILGEVLTEAWQRI